MPWERDLAQLERAINALTAEYDAFLYGTAPRPPVASRRNVERMVRKLASVEADNAADRFRFSTIQGHWSRLLERWERLQGEKEAGRRPGIYGHFRPSRTAEDGIRVPHAPPALNTAATASVEPGGDVSDARRALYEKYLEAKKAKGEPADGVDFERFADSLEREKNRLKDRLGGVEVEFDVAERDGRVKLIARKKT